MLSGRVHLQKAWVGNSTSIRIYFSDCVMEWTVSICRLFAFNWAAELEVCWPLESRYKAGGGREVAGVEILDTNRFYNKTPIISARPCCRPRSWSGANTGIYLCCHSLHKKRPVNNPSMWWWYNQRPNKNIGKRLSLRERVKWPTWMSTTHKNTIALTFLILLILYASCKLRSSNSERTLNRVPHSQ